jgi:LmbE family N-acetylglucosaminyl deacetylase
LGSQGDDMIPRSLPERLGFLFLMLVILASLLMADGKGKPQKCIIVFGCHADDVEEMAGGTFAKYIAEGYKGVFVCVENNLSGNQIEKVPGNWDFDRRKVTGQLTHSPRQYPVDALETSQARQEEATRAAKVFGAEPVFFMLVEPEVQLGRKTVLYGTKEYNQYDPPGRKHLSIGGHIGSDVDAVVDLLRKYQPEITIIHTLGGEKLDHAESAYMMYVAFKKAIAEGIPVGKLWMNVDGWFLNGEAQSTGRGKADVRIDVRQYLKTKYAALDKEVSQNGGMGRQYVLVRKEKQPKENVEEFITVEDNSK